MITNSILGGLALGLVGGAALLRNNHKKDLIDDWVYLFIYDCISYKTSFHQMIKTKIDFFYGIPSKSHFFFLYMIKNHNKDINLWFFTLT